MVRRLIYLSNALVPFSSSDLDELRVEARRYNAEQGVTGVLVYGEGRFIQFVEGESLAVEAAMKRVHQDPRHTICAVVLDRHDSEQLFLGWALACESGSMGMPLQAFPQWITTHLMARADSDEDRQAIELLRRFCADLLSARRPLLVRPVCPGANFDTRP